MWKPDGKPISSLEAKPGLIEKIQEEGFEIHDKADPYDNRTRVRLRYPDATKRNQKFYSRFQDMPSMTVIEMVQMRESKRLGIEFFTKADLPVLDVWDNFEAVLVPNSDSFFEMSTYKDTAKNGSGLNIPHNGNVLFSMLRQDYRKMSDRIDEFPVNKEDLITVGYSRLVRSNPKCFLKSTVEIAKSVIDTVNNRIDSIQGPAWEFCYNLGKRMSEAEEKGQIYKSDFEMYLEDVKQKDEATYKKFMEGYSAL